MDKKPPETHREKSIEKFEPKWDTSQTSRLMKNDIQSKSMIETAKRKQDRRVTFETSLNVVTLI